MKEEKKSNQGITLIALVITIIVLLILAAVSISMLTGENGILKRANEAKEETAIATEDEQRKMAKYEASMNISGMTFQGVEIPEGFAPTRMPGESTVEEGLVITDSQGNEFVWIPCKYEKNSEGSSEDEIYYNTGNNDDNREEEWRVKQYYYNGGTWYDAQPHTIGKQSIEKHGGFYVARYEAGVPKEASFYVDPKGRGELKYNTENGVRNDTNKIKNGEIIPVCQKGCQAWNFISQENAEIAAGKMVDDNPDVQSYLIDSHAWNTICRLIEKKYTDGSRNVMNSTKWGNYENNLTTKYEKLKGLWANYDDDEGTWKNATKYENTPIPKKTRNRHMELATGICEDFKAYNIYDLAGNMWEWTTEKGKKPDSNSNVNTNTSCYEVDCTENPETNAPNAVARGDCFGVGEIEKPVVSATGREEAISCSSSIGFRVVLYLK